MKYYKHFDRLQICGYWFYIARLKRFLKFIFVLWRTDHWKHFGNYFFELSWSKWYYLLSLSILTVVWRFIIAWDRLGLLGTHFCHQTEQWCFIHTNYMDVWSYMNDHPLEYITVYTYTGIIILKQLWIAYWVAEKILDIHHQSTHYLHFFSQLGIASGDILQC